MLKFTYISAFWPTKQVFEGSYRNRYFRFRFSKRLLIVLHKGQEDTFVSPTPWPTGYDERYEIITEYLQSKDEA